MTYGCEECEQLGTTFVEKMASIAAKIEKTLIAKAIRKKRRKLSRLAKKLVKKIRTEKVSAAKLVACQLFKSVSEEQLKVRSEGLV